MALLPALLTCHLSLVTAPSPRMTATAEPDDAVPLTGEEHKPDFPGRPRGLFVHVM
jgi:hypothetical protein